MKFETNSGKQRSRRSRFTSQAPAVVESLEIRSLMTVLSPTGTVNDARPTIAWEAVDNATSYDLWVTDAEQRTVEFIKREITATNFTPTTDLNLGRTRVWVRPNFANAPSGPWSAPAHFVVQVTPKVTGPAAPLQKLAITKPTISWMSPPGASKFEIYFLDRATLVPTTIEVPNLTPRLDADGNTQPDGMGDILRDEIRTYTLPDDLLMGGYRVQMRTTDDGGRVSAWSRPFDFEVAPAVTVTRPKGVSFENPPLLEWQAVPGATDYDVWLAKAVTPNTPIYNLKLQTGTSYQVPAALAQGDYVFWIRAHRREIGRPETVTPWGAGTTYSTIRNPVISGPAGIFLNDPKIRIVTDARPTVEWNRVDRAARYEIWVERSDGRKPYLITTSPTNSYQFEQDIQRGRYLVWVRAVSTTGELTGWSKSYSFDATGGVPIITSPVANSNVVPIPNITWTPVADAKSYEIWIAWVGNDFDYIRTTDITITTFAPTDPLPTGTYRVWVRAIKADGTPLTWSTSTTFSVTSIELEQPAGEVPELLDSLLPTTRVIQADAVAEVKAKKSVEFTNDDAPPEREFGLTEAIVMLPVPVTIPAMTPETEGLIEQLAEECTSTEWWMPQVSEA